MERKHLILKLSAIIVTTIVIVIFVYNQAYVKNTYLGNDSLAGIHLMQKADKVILEKELGKLVKDNIDDKGRLLFFDSRPYYVTVRVDKNNEVIGIFVEYTKKISNTKFNTSRNIGPECSFYDVIEAYGSNYYKKTYGDFMGSGDGYFITYVDKKQNTSIEFEFTKGNPNSDNEEEFLTHITLKK